MEKEKVECPVIINGSRVIVTVPMGGKRDIDVEEFYSTVMYFCKKHPAYKTKLKDDEINTVILLLKEPELKNFVIHMRKFLASGKTYRIAGILISVELLTDNVKPIKAVERTEPAVVPIPLGDRVLIRQDDIDEAGEGELIRNTAVTKPCRGIVLAVGPDVKQTKLVKDAHVSFTVFGGSPLEHDGVIYMVIKEMDIETILP